MKTKTKQLAECALLVAMAIGLQFFKIEAPFGGSITAGCMVPLVIASYRNGVKWGLGTAFVFSAVKLLLGLENFSYITGAGSFIAVFLFDYILAYTAVGIAGFIKSDENDSTGKLAFKAGAGAFVGMLVRYLCHIVSGAVVWYDLTRVWEEGNAESIVFKYGKWMYSVVYNGAYMLPETIITVVVTVVLVFYFGKNIRRSIHAKQ